MGICFPKPEIPETKISKAQNLNVNKVDLYNPNCLRDKSELIIQLLNQKDPVTLAQLSLKNEDGSTPLHFALNFGFENIAQSMIEAGANVNEVNNFGSSALMHWAYYGVGHENNVTKQFLNKLVAAGADLNARTKKGGTALHVACIGTNRKNAQQIVAWLLQMGADGSLTTMDGYTPLMLAARCDFSDVNLVVSTLMEGYKGIDINICVPQSNADFSGFTALAFAEFEQNELAAAQLRKYDANLGLESVHPPPHDVSFRNDLRVRPAVVQLIKLWALYVIGFDTDADHVRKLVEVISANVLTKTKKRITTTSLGTISLIEAEPSSRSSNVAHPVIVAEVVSSSRNMLAIDLANVLQTSGIVDQSNAQVLLKANVDAETLSFLTDEALKEIGIESAFMRGKLLAWGAKWQRGEV